MIRIQFREHHFRVKCDRFTLRFWISASGCMRGPQEILDRIAGVRHLMAGLPAEARPSDVAKAVQEYFEPADGISAYEVVSNGTQNGLVDYIEWP